MSYSTIADVQIAAGGEARLRELSDVDRTNQVNLAAVESAIVEADAIINSWVHKRHGIDIPAPAPPTIRAISAAMAVYILKTRKANMVSEVDIQLQEQRIEQLRQFSRGETTLGVYPEPAKSEKIIDLASDRSDLVISRNSLKGFC